MRSAFADIDLKSEPPRIPGICSFPSSLGPGAAGCDEGTHAQQHEEKQNGGHSGFFLYGYGVWELTPAQHLKIVHDAPGGAEEAEQSDGDGDVHVEHALFRVVSEREAAEDA